MGSKVFPVLPALVAAWALGCSDGSAGDDPGWTATRSPCVNPGGTADCPVAGWPDRPYRVFVPSTADLRAPNAVVVMFHGGTGNATAGQLSSCPTAANGSANTLGAGCLHQVAEREGFVAVYPNGTPVTAGSNGRAFNAGGGADGWQCVGGAACEQDVDDEAYVTAVLEDLDAWIHVDRNATFATGLSNGAALAHRLACTLSTRFAAIASVGGGNQYATVEPCAQDLPVAILQIHGEDDPCWTYEESTRTCAAGGVGRKVGALESAAAWASRYGCTAGPVETTEADVDGDGKTTIALRWSGCAADVGLLRLQGAGHTWPNGLQYAPETTIGPVFHDWGTERIWAFFDSHRR